VNVFLIIIRLFIWENNGKEWKLVFTGIDDSQIVCQLNYIPSATDVTVLHSGATMVECGMLTNADRFSSSMVCATHRKD